MRRGGTTGKGEKTTKNRRKRGNKKTVAPADTERAGSLPEEENRDRAEYGW